MQISELAAAKINLALHVVGQRSDGYHRLESLVVFASLGDRLDVRVDTANSLTVKGRFAADVPTDDSNLIVKARDAYRRVFAADAAPRLAVTLDKELPVASGIGGGSSDAAAMLRAMARIDRRAPDDAALIDLAATLGADVPMCLIGRPAIASGIGERLAAIERFPALDLVLVNPGEATHTPAIFKALQHKDNAPLPPLPGRLTRPKLIEWLGKTRNDLAAPALAAVPAIGDAIGALASVGAAFARMSGSGATCFGLFTDAVAAQAAAARITAARPELVRQCRADLRLPWTGHAMTTSERAFIPLGIAVLTVSDTRTLADDKSGATLVERIETAGHRVAARTIVKDDPTAIRDTVLAWSKDAGVDVVITTGGTGFTGRDVTPEALEPIFEKRMDGFSAIFHRISYDKIGISTIQSRATGGVVNATFVFVLPGSPGACRDAWDAILEGQLDYRHRPCNFVEIMPRLDEHLRRGV